MDISYVALPFEHQILQPRSILRKVTQTNMIYIVGLPLSVAQTQIIASEPYCGQYGHVTKVTIKQAVGYHSQCYNAYVTFESEESASLAVMALRCFFIGGHKISASYGTTKYCSSFLRHGKCRKNDCMFHHRIEPEKEIYEEDNKKVFNLQKQMAKQFMFDNFMNIDFSSTLENYIFPSKWSVRQFLISQGIEQIKQNYNNKRLSEAQTECSVSGVHKQLEDQLQIQNDLLMIKRIKRATERKKSFFDFVPDEKSQQFEPISKHLENYMNSSGSDI